MPARARCLVTNWSVHSQSARELTSDLFRRQAADPKLSRSEALRQAMIALIDGEGFEGRQGRDAVQLRAPAVLGAVHDHRGRGLGFAQRRTRRCLVRFIGCCTGGQKNRQLGPGAIAAR